jgi:hypothetical protein
MLKSKRTLEVITPEKRHHMIAVAAYFRAKRRGFQGGCPLQDWLEAECEIDQMYFQPAQLIRGALVFL